MYNLVTLCAVLATTVYFVDAYDFEDSSFRAFKVLRNHTSTTAVDMQPQQKQLLKMPTTRVGETSRESNNGRRPNNPKTTQSQYERLSSDLEEALDSLNDVPLHSRSRRDEEAAVAIDDKCKKRHRKPRLCCADETFDQLNEKDKDTFKSCFKETLGVDKHDHHHKKLDLFSCEEVEKRKNEMICIQQCIGQKRGLLDNDGKPKSEALAKYIKDNFAKEAWIQTAIDKISSTCLADAKNATENQVKPTSQNIKVCNPAGMALKHCVFKEIQLSCPADQIKDKTACDKFQDRIKKGFDFFGPPPPPPFDGSKDD